MAEFTPHHNIVFSMTPLALIGGYRNEYYEAVQMERR